MTRRIENRALSPQSFLHLTSGRNLPRLPERQFTFPGGLETESGIHCNDHRFVRMDKQSPLTKLARWEILATDVEESDTARGNVPQPKVKAQAWAKAAKAKASTVPGPEKWLWPGKGRSMGKGARMDRQVSAMGVLSTAIVSPVARNGKLFVIEQRASGLCLLGCRMCRSQAQTQDDESLCSPRGRRRSKMAHTPGLTGTYDVCAVQKSQKVKRLEVTVDRRAEESLWPVKLLQEIPSHNKEKAEERSFWWPMVRRWVIMTTRRSSLEVTRAA